MEKSRAKSNYDLPLLSGLCAILFSAWMYFLSINVSEGFDEAEHMHVAWMMFKGMKPITDFWQHHMPLFWEVAQVFYYLGGEGPQALYFGRMLVLVAVTFFIIGLFVYVRQVLQEAGKSESKVIFPFAIALSLYASVTSVFSTILATRPESISLPFIIWSLIAWRSAKSRRKEPLQGLAFGVLAGALFGIAGYFTPRALCVGFLFFLTRDNMKVPVFWIRRIAPFAFGFVGIIFAIMTLFGHDWRYLLFVLKFSTHLARTGEDIMGWKFLYAQPFFVFATCIAVYTVAVFQLWLPKNEQRNLLFHILNLLLILTVSIYTSWPHVYAQNLFGFVTAFAIAICELAPYVEWPSTRMVHRMFSVTVGLCAINAICADRLLLVAGETLTTSVELRDAFLARLEPQDRVMVSYPNHPVTAMDASYFGPGFTDYPERMCVAIKTWKGWPHFPPCDYFSDFMKSNPKLIDDKFVMNIPAAQKPTVTKLMSEKYTGLNVKVPNLGTTLQTPVHVRKNEPGESRPERDIASQQGG